MRRHQGPATSCLFYVRVERRVQSRRHPITPPVQKGYPTTPIEDVGEGRLLYRTGVDDRSSDHLCGTLKQINRHHEVRLSHF